VPIVATVGAVDAFNGGLAAGLATGLGLLEAARLGVAAGASCVTKAGAQDAMPTLAEVRGLLRHL
jgi:ribokinase